MIEYEEPVRDYQSVFKPVLVSRQVSISRRWFGSGLDIDLVVNDLVLDSVLSLDDLMTLNESIWRLENVAYIMKIKHFCEFVILAMFSDENNSMLRTHTWSTQTWILSTRHWSWD